MRECPRKAEDAHCGMDYAYLKQSFVLHCIQPRSGKLTAAHCSSLQLSSGSGHLHTLRVSPSPLAPLAPLTHRRWADESDDETRILSAVAKLA